MAGKPKTIDQYLAALSEDKRATLEKVRKTIRAAAPKAEECISYQVPAFRLDGSLPLNPRPGKAALWVLTMGRASHATKGPTKCSTERATSSL